MLDNGYHLPLASGFAFPDGKTNASRSNRNAIERDHVGHSSIPGSAIKTHTPKTENRVAIGLSEITDTKMATNTTKMIPIVYPSNVASTWSHVAISSNTGILTTPSANERHVNEDEKRTNGYSYPGSHDESFHLVFHLIGIENKKQTLADSFRKGQTDAHPPPPRPFPMWERAQNTIARTTDSTINRNTMEVQSVEAAPLPTYVSLMASLMGPENAAKTRMRTKTRTKPPIIPDRLIFRAICSITFRCLFRGAYDAPGPTPFRHVLPNAPFNPPSASRLYVAFATTK